MEVDATAKLLYYHYTYPNINLLESNILRVLLPDTYIMCQISKLSIALQTYHSET